MARTSTDRKATAAGTKFFATREDAALWAATELSKDSWELAESALEWALAPASVPFSGTTKDGLAVSVHRELTGFRGCISQQPPWLARLLSGRPPR